MRGEIQETKPVQEYQILHECQKNIHHDNVVCLPHPHCLLSFLVETPDNQHEHGADTTLEESKKESLDIKAAMILTDSRQDKAHTPDSHDHTGDTFNGKTLGQRHGWIYSSNEPQIEY